MSWFLLCLYFAWLAAQNFLLPWIYRQQLLPAWQVGMLMASKEAILAIALAVLVPRVFGREWRWNAADKFALAYLGLLTFYLLFGPRFLPQTAPLALRAISARSLVSPALFYAWGRLTFLSIRELRRFLWFVVGLQVCVAGFGLFEWLFLPTSFWSDTVGAGTFMLDVKGMLENQNVIDGLPSNMFHFGIRRLIATYGDPLAMGIASVFPLLLCVAWLLRRRALWPPRTLDLYWWMAMTVIAAALLLTIGRESIGAAAMGTVLLTWWSGKYQKMALPAAIVLLGLLLLPQTWSYVTSTVTFHEASAATHLRFLEVGWERVPAMLVGKGLGEAGGWAFSLAGVKSEVGENSYFELMSQTGIVSVALLCGLMIAMALKARGCSRASSDPWIAAAFLASAAHVLARCVAGVFSPSLFGFVPLASFFFFCGAGFSTRQRAVQRPYLVAGRVLVLQRASVFSRRGESLPSFRTPSIRPRSQSS
jgi:uncharacterized protein YndB with AHSA1/START domain